MKAPVFLDSGIFVAFLNSADQWHEPAVAMFGRKPSGWITSYLVLAESYSWFLHRHGEEAARTFREFLGSLAGLEIMEVNRRHHQEALRMLDRLRGSKLTYVDASSLAFMERRRIRTVWSTDHHLTLTGAEVLPRS